MQNNEVGKAIKAAFDYVITIYKETSLLMQDLEIALNHRGFYWVNGIWTGANLSTSPANPDLWLTKSVAHYWIEKTAYEQDINAWKGPNTLYLSNSVILYLPEFDEPWFMYGVLEAMDLPNATYQYDWLLKVISNQEKNFDYSTDGREYTNSFDISCRQPIHFKCKLANDILWPKQGKVVIHPLTDISSREKINDIADKMKDLWATYRNKQ